jgi:hypothetical protein
MSRLLRSLTLSALVFFVGAMLTAATADFSECEIEYVWEGSGVRARCAGICEAGGDCDFNIDLYENITIYSCKCPDGTFAQCIGVLVAIGRHTYFGCIDELKPCGPINPGRCETIANTTPFWKPVCLCRVPNPN